MYLIIIFYFNEKKKYYKATVIIMCILSVFQLINNKIKVINCIIKNLRYLLIDIFSEVYSFKVIIILLKSLTGELYVLNSV